ncbi:MAG TPA: hypothetical protein VKU02_16010 [Gemmataceae bacterium]|nr:hypothetical protein [Gemmataceae bacterium]
MTIEVEQEEDGRRIAEVVDLSGVFAYGQTRAEAIIRGLLGGGMNRWPELHGEQDCNPATYDSRTL